MRLAPRIAVGVSVLTLVVSVIGFVATLMLNVFVFDDYKKYGEVSIPGSVALQLPAGEVTISFHTVFPGGGSGGLPVPPLKLRIEPPPGVAEPEVTESIGATTTVNNDARVCVWVAEIPQPGTYDVTADGEVDGYINPRLAFGHGSSYGWLLWGFGSLFALGLVALLALLFGAARRAKETRPLTPEELADLDGPTWSNPPAATPEAGYEPDDRAVRLEQLRTLKELRDSGALTDEEFKAEKRRILEN